MNMFQKFLSLILFLKRNKKYAIPENISILNLGPGQYISNKCFHIEGAPFYFYLSLPIFVKYLIKLIAPKKTRNNLKKKELKYKGIKTVYFDFKYGIPVHDNSVSYIYSSHMLEHFYYEDAKIMLLESKRVLKNDGIIRIVVPNLKEFINDYLKGDKLSLIGIFITRIRLKGKSGSVFHQHKFMYDFDLLSELLKECGFQNITEHTYREGKLPYLDEYEFSYDHSLFVEAVNN